MRRLLLVVLLLVLSSPAGAVWWDRVGDLHTGGGNCMLPDPAHDRLLIGGDSGYRIYYPLTEEWLIRENTSTWSIHSLLAHPTDPLFLLSGCYGGYFNGWVEDHYGLVTEGPVVLGGAIGAVMGLARLPGQVDVLYACAMDGEGDPGGVFRSLDGGQSWTLFYDFSPSDPIALAIATNADLLVGLTYPIGIARGIDAGQSWVDVTGDMASTGSNFIERIAVDPADPSTSTPCRAPASPRTGGILFRGVYETRTAAAHWEHLLPGDV